MKLNYYYIISGILLVLYLVSTLMGVHNTAGGFLVAMFISLSMGFRQSDKLKGLAFTIIIFAGVALAMYKPEWLQSWNGYKLTNLITPLIQIIMFGMGTSMSLKDFNEVIKTPKGVVIGVMAQFIIMPLLGFTLAHTFSFPPEIAAGIVLIGCSPSGLASNVMAYLAKANLALSITITSITTLLAPLITPVLMKLLAGTLVEIDMMKMMWDITKMIIFPIAGGLIFNKLLSGKIKWLDDAMPLLSMSGIAFIITIITAAGQKSLLEMGFMLIIVVLIHNSCGYFLGYWAARLLGMVERDCRTVAIEVGMQNAGLASGIAKEMGKIATIGLAPAVFGPIMNISGSALANWWHNRQPKD
jgi:bile acid:Na+ symporter, BASS family